MAQTRSYARSFGAGEVTTELFGRLDVAKRQEGLALCRNFITRPQGAVVNRTGTEFVLEVKDSSKYTRLIPFSYTNTQTYAIEVATGAFRFHTQGATITNAPAVWSSSISYLPNDLVVQGGVQYACITANNNSVPPSANWRTLAWSSSTAYNVGDLVTSGGVTYYCILAHTNQAPPNATYWYAQPAGIYEIPNGYQTADLPNLHYTQSADVLTLVHPNYPVMELRRYGATDWQFTAPAFSPPSNQLSTPACTANSPGGVGSGSILYSYVVTGVQTADGQETVASAPTQGTTFTITSATSATPSVITTSVVSGLAVGDTCFLQLTIAYYPYNVLIQGNYTVASVSGSTVTLNNSSGLPFGINPSHPFVSGTIAISGVKNNLAVAGNTNVISWQDNSPAGTYVRYNVYRLTQGLYGYVGQAASTVFTDNNIIPDATTTPPIADTGFNDQPGDYPGAVTYFQQRRVFGGTTKKPQNLWMTRSGTESNMSYSIPVRADNRIAVRIAAREASAVQHLVPVANLMILTPSTEWLSNGGSAGAAITPTSFQVQPQSYVGSNNVTPITVGNVILFATSRGGHLREMSYSWQAGSYVSADLSILAAHLFDYQTVNDMAYARGPYPVLWAVSSSGKLLGLTYVPEQQVAAWHQHDTGNGDAFESCCAITEGGEDMLYVVVNRTIMGATKRYVERLRSRNFANQSQAFFVDCGVIQTFGSPVTNLSGLTWLAGRTVNVLADGAAVNGLTVSNTGTLTLPNAASTVVVGLPIVAQIQTPPLATQLDPALSQGRAKNVNRIWLRVFNSAPFAAGPNFSSLVNYPGLPPAQVGVAPALITAELELALMPSWNQDGSVCIQQTDPLPLDIVDMTVEVSVGGG